MKLPILSKGINEAPLAGRDKLGWVNVEKGLPGPNRESLF
jgi:hypothetical protein